MVERSFRQISRRYAAERRRRARELLRQGATVRQVGPELGISPSTVAKEDCQELMFHRVDGISSVVRIRSADQTTHISLTMRCHEVAGCGATWHAE